MNRLFFVSFIVCIIFLSNNLYALSLSLTGKQCLNAEDLSDTSSNDITITSRFSVIEELSSGMYKLKLTGGFPRINSLNESFCIDTSMGHVGDLPDTDNFTEEKYLPKEATFVDGFGYFNGELIIVINYIHSTLQAKVSTTYPYEFFSSPAAAFTSTFIFSFDGTSNFHLKKWTFSSSRFGSFGFAAPPGAYVEVITPNKELAAITSTERSVVIYKLEGN